MPSYRPVAERFWEKVAKGDGCWEWLAHRKQRGYGTLQIGRRSVAAHRVSWELHYGPIPDGLWVLHRCDNPPCVRPDHLFLGDAAANGRDMGSKGRAAIQQHPELVTRGEAHPWAKLNAEAVRQVRAMLETGLSLRRVGAQFGVGPETIRAIRDRRTWAHVQ